MTNDEARQRIADLTAQHTRRLQALAGHHNPIIAATAKAALHIGGKTMNKPSHDLAVALNIAAGGTAQQIDTLLVSAADLRQPAPTPAPCPLAPAEIVKRKD